MSATDPTRARHAARARATLPGRTWRLAALPAHLAHAAATVGTPPPAPARQAVAQLAAWANQLAREHAWTAFAALNPAAPGARTRRPAARRQRLAADEQTATLGRRVCAALRAEHHPDRRLGAGAVAGRARLATQRRSVPARQAGPPTWRSLRPAPPPAASAGGGRWWARTACGDLDPALFTAATTPTRVLPDVLNGDEWAHDRGDRRGPTRHADNQARPDRPVTGFVSPSGPHRAHPTAGGRHILRDRGERALPWPHRLDTAVRQRPRMVLPSKPGQRRRRYDGDGCEHDVGDRCAGRSHLVDLRRSSPSCAGSCRRSSPSRMSLYTPQVQRAKQVCARCPVQPQCLTEALVVRLPRHTPNQYEVGVVAGTTPAERARLRATATGGPDAA
jgi:hypothetical protein